MTQPRCVLPGSTYLLTRRTLRRHHLLRPDKEMTNLLQYALAVCAARYHIEIHAFCAMSTHLHAVVTDRERRLPLFLGQFHRLVALATKVLRKWEGPVWEPERTSAVRLETPDAVVEKIAYVLANPVSAGLVRHADDWPGAKTRVEEIGRTGARAIRPDAYFDRENPDWPDEVMLEVALPPGVESGAAGAFRDAIAAAVVGLERVADERSARDGRHFVGPVRVTTTSPYERATTFEPLRGRNPTFAVGAVAGAYESAVTALRGFREAYRAALATWRAGIRSVMFPPGTWWMVQSHSALVAA